MGSVRPPQVPDWHMASSVFSILSWFYKEPGGLGTGSSVDDTFVPSSALHILGVCRRPMSPALCGKETGGT